MISNLFIHTITTTRPTQSSLNTLGEPVTSDVTVYTNIPARIETYQEETKYLESNERKVNKTIIYVNSQYSNFQLQDKISRNSIYIGLVAGINPAVLGNSTSIDHYELIIENP